ncbi:hypothetical protein Pth03_29580 [Planotetraspora thailandica]|uniref:Uncharacterized protein n=1 Tax=Planotetraspora thailandica TaxID=487172 RepID=A0A8J3V5V3_9ACTN|nr:hypothetical protein Pth03_29580 [Planotetraspora thailandica]
MVVAFASDHALVSRTQLRRARARIIARRETCLGLRVEASVDVMAPNRIRRVKVPAAHCDHERRHPLPDMSPTRARREYRQPGANQVINADAVAHNRGESARPRGRGVTHADHAPGRDPRFTRV